MVSVLIPTADGTFAAVFSDRGLAQLDFPTETFPGSARQAIPIHLVEWVQLTTKALESALQGRQPERLPPMDLRGATSFQQAVWEGLLRIPAGTTRTYGELARALQRPAAARAVGQACGANRIPVLIPCHRVLAGQGRLGGFSGGLEWKRTLLARERSWPL